MHTTNNWKFRVVGILVVLVTLWYLPWVFTNLNLTIPWLSIPFAIASLMTSLTALVAVINNWYSAVPASRSVPAGTEPEVAVIIPTCREPAHMVYATAQSVFEQNYPRDKITVIIGDDASSPAIANVAELLRYEYPDATTIYHVPPRRGDPARQGEAKAGNLNAALGLLDREMSHISFVETRDADDLVGDSNFLRQTLGQLVVDSNVAFVQTIKEAVVSPGDPFGNLESIFYRRAMLSKNAVNAVFPCGSGLVWRREALTAIGGFPTWNLVEDLQAGVEVLRRGWRGLYLPIVGAVGQTAPEDIPNSFKQRGTWALDTMRMAFWGDKRGLTLRQYLQFIELSLFYVLSFALLVLGIVPVFALAFDLHPLVVSNVEYALHFWPQALAVELLLICLADGLPYEALWRARQTWLGLAPVYARATLIALLAGSNRKPDYRVTRKMDVHDWYWKETLPQTALFVALIAASIYHISTYALLPAADLGSLFWAGFFALALSRTVRNAWYGISLPEVVASAAKHAGVRVLSVLRAAHAGRMARQHQSTWSGNESKEAYS